MREKLLSYSFVVSLIVNVLFIVVVGNSDIFQTQAIKNELHAKHIRLMRPPVRKRAPPRKKPPPPIKKAEIKPPPPMPRPVVEQHTIQPIVRAPAPPVVVATPKGNEEIKAPTVAAAPPTQPQPPQPPVVKQAPQPPAPPVVKQAPPPQPPPPQPPAPKKPVHVTPDAIGTWRDINLPEGIDPGDLAATDIVATFMVDASGNAHFKSMRPTTSGNRDIDDAIKDAINSMKFIPKTDGDGNPISSEYTHEFTIG